jgi:hypothetical protein
MRMEGDYFQRMRWMCVGAWAALTVTLTAVACKHGKCEDGPTSTAQGSSHNSGEDCMRCHLPDGEGEICWKVAGTIFDSGGQHPFVGAQVRLFSKPHGTGEVHLAMESDRSGNIHSSEALAFGQGLFPAVIRGLDTLFMTGAIHDGACNRCHGISTERIRTP